MMGVAGADNTKISDTMESISGKKRVYVRPDIAVVPLRGEAAMTGLIGWSGNSDDNSGGDAGDARIGRNPNTGGLTPFPDDYGGKPSPWEEQGEISF